MSVVYVVLFSDFIGLYYANRSYLQHLNHLHPRRYSNESKCTLVSEHQLYLSF